MTGPFQFDQPPRKVDTGGFNTDLGSFSFDDNGVKQPSDPFEPAVHGVMEGMGQAIPDFMSFLARLQNFGVPPGAEKYNHSAELDAQAQRASQIAEGLTGHASGTGAGTGRVAGELGASIPLYGPLSEASSGLMRGMLPKAVEDAFAKWFASPSIATRIASRAAADVAGQAPLTGAFVFESPPGDRLKQAGIQGGASALFGALGGIGEPPKAPVDITDPNATPADLSPDRLAALEKSKTDAQARVATRKAKEQLNQLARADWVLKNPDKKWSMLSSEGRRAVYDAFVKEQGDKFQQLLEAAGKAPSPAQGGSAVENTVPPAQEAPGLGSGPDEPLAGPSGSAPLPPKPPTTPPSVNDLLDQLPKNPLASQVTPPTSHEAIPNLPPTIPEEAVRNPIDQKLDELKQRLASGENVSPDEAARLNKEDPGNVGIPTGSEWWESMTPKERRALMKDMGLVDYARQYSKENDFYNLPVEIRQPLITKWSQIFNTSEAAAQQAIIDEVRNKGHAEIDKLVSDGWIKPDIGEEMKRTPQMHGESLFDYVSRITRKVTEARKATDIAAPDVTNLEPSKPTTPKPEDFKSDLTPNAPKPGDNGPTGEQIIIPEPTKNLNAKANDLIELLKNLPKYPGHEGPDIWWNRVGSDLADGFGIPDVPYEELSIGDKNKVGDLWNGRRVYEKLRSRDIQEIFQTWNKFPETYGPKATYDANENYINKVDPALKEQFQNGEIPGTTPHTEKIQPRIIEGKSDAQIWNEDIPPDEKVNFLQGIGEEGPDAHKTANTPWDELTPEEQTNFKRDFKEYFNQNKDQIDVGHTVYEKSAQEYADRTKVPSDLKNEFIDKLIDGKTSGKSGEDIWNDLLNWADANEVSEGQLRGSLKETLGITPEQLTKPVEPSAGAEPSTAPRTPPSSPEAPAPNATQEPSSPPPASGQKTYVEPRPDIAGDITTNPTVVKGVTNEGKIPQTAREMDAIVQNIRKGPRKLTDGELDSAIDYLQKEIPYADPDKAADLGRTLDKFINERSVRRNPPKPPTQANMPPAAFGAALGWTYGYISSDDEHRINNAFLWALIGAGGAHFTVKGYQKFRESMVKPEPPMFPGQDKLPKVVVPLRELKPNEPGLLTRIRRFYEGTIRFSTGLERLDARGDFGKKIIPTELSPGRRAAIFDRWINVSEEWMNKQPSYFDEQTRQIVKLDALPMHQIVYDIAKGEIQNLGQLLVARASLELQGIRTTPYNAVEAELIYRNAPEYLHQAADEFRKFHLALVDYLVHSGIISDATRAKFAQQSWYTPLMRVLYANQGELEAMAKGNILGSPNPVKAAAGGSKLAVKNPVEATYELIPRYIRAGEYNKIKQLFWALAKSRPELEGMLIKRMENKANPNIAQIETLSNAIKNEVPVLTKAEADQLASSLNLDKINPTNPAITMYVNGKLSSFRIDPEVFDAFKGMLPKENTLMDALVNGPAAIAQAVAKGIVYDPYFVGSMSFIDVFQTALQSQYGMVPGLGAVRGWWNIVKNSKAVQDITAAGGVSPIQATPYNIPKEAAIGVESYRGSPLKTSVEQIRELHPLSAYQTLMLTVSEAARMGEALAALDHGGSVMDAVYAARHVAGNIRMQGHLASIRAFHRIAVFSRPAIAAMDEMVNSMGVHPFRSPDDGRLASGLKFMLRGMGLIGIPSAILWNHNKDDTEIRQLRQTTAGAKYWFYRLPDGDIFKVRKPHLMGQMFGTTMEQVLDKMYNTQGPNSTQWLDALEQDAAFNVIPQIGVVPLSLMTGKNLSYGASVTDQMTNVVPDKTAQLTPQLQDNMNTSMPARVIADKLAPWSEHLQPGTFLSRVTSPMGIDYILNNVGGMMGQDALKLIDATIKYDQFGFSPSKDELPIVGRAFARYPSLNVAPVQEFYRMDGFVQQVAKSVTDLAQNDPLKLPGYMERHLGDMQLAATYGQTRQQIGSYRRAIEDARWLAMGGQISQQQFKDIENQFLRQIIMQTEIANSITKSIRNQMPTMTEK